MWYAFIAYIIVSVPSSYLFGFTLGLGALGIWFGFPLGLSTAGILFLTRFLRKTRGYAKAA
jgi:MATE family multidrug resistance protein